MHRASSPLFFTAERFQHIAARLLFVFDLRGVYGFPPPSVRPMRFPADRLHAESAGHIPRLHSIHRSDRTARSIFLSGNSKFPQRQFQAVRACHSAPKGVRTPRGKNFFQTVWFSHASLKSASPAVKDHEPSRKAPRSPNDPIPIHLALFRFHSRKSFD